VAALSLAKIDPKSAADCLIPLIPQRPQWSKSSTAAILAKLGRKNVTLPLINTIKTVAKNDLPRMIGFLPFADTAAASEAVAEILRQSSDIEIISACLKEIKSFADKSWISKVRPYLQHESWIVRVQAVNTLGDLADINSLDDFVAKLHDQNWWVRYRSAQAIINMPLITRSQTDNIISSLDDQFAKDILEQVMAEKKRGDVL
ncbi:MAG: HEAT repeat domain-containing protein, partial [Peptococcaceae bacterium]|nr:HEAT repeat domain-containing protein [Peptococcaceae bacterium]